MPDMNINTVDTINLDNPWWFDKINNEITVASKLYTIAGSYALNSMTAAWCTYFNKKLINDFELENPYELVNSGKWTFDKMVEMGTVVCADLNGNGLIDDEDRFGFSHENAYSLRYGMGTTITNFDSDGYPIMDGASEKMIIVFDKIKSLYNNDKLFYKDTGNDFSKIDLMFTNNQSLFHSYTIKLTEDAIMREFEDYGIVPTPKLDEKQENYYALSYGDSYSIPIIVNDENISGAVLEALNRESYLNVIPSYYDIALQRKYTRDDESSAMLDIILDN